MTTNRIGTEYYLIRIQSLALNWFHFDSLNISRRIESNRNEKTRVWSKILLEWIKSGQIRTEWIVARLPSLISIVHSWQSWNVWSFLNSFLKMKWTCKEEDISLQSALLRSHELAKKMILSYYILNWNRALWLWVPSPCFVFTQWFN